MPAGTFETAFPSGPLIAARCHAPINRSLSDFESDWACDTAEITTAARIAIAIFFIISGPPAWRGTRDNAPLLLRLATKLSRSLQYLRSSTQPEESQRSLPAGRASSCLESERSTPSWPTATQARLGPESLSSPQRTF